ncbi:sugar-binding domain-containing protein [Neobacillus drentensis]|uniref:glycoside hydrolase family 2 protein n=1 Tax=Neobacillus drentensis TaxID=220684 RepID=UPI002FFE4F7E
MDNKVNLSGDWDIYVNFANPIEKINDITLITDWTKQTVPGCWEQSVKDKKSDGPVWYRKYFTIPESWEGNLMSIHFEGVNYYCEVWLNGKSVGSHEGGWNGFELDITKHILFSEPNEIFVKVYKQGERFPIRECLAGFFPDVGVIFGGIWKPVTVKLLPSVTVKDIFVKPDIKEAKIEVEFDINNHLLNEENIEITFSLFNPNDILEQTITNKITAPGIHNMEKQLATINLENEIHHWSPETPQLYRLETKVMLDGKEIFTESTKFGMKDVHIKGDHIYLNGNPLYLRGVLHWGWYSEIIAPIPSREEILEELQRVKDSGFNLVKHCLYVPTKDYLEIADEMGIFIWQELPMWLPQVSDEFYNRVYYQYERIIKEIRNHPSIILWTLGCELDHSVNAKFLSDLYETAKMLTNNAIIRDNSGSGECYGGLLKEYADFYDYHFYNDVHFYRDLINQFAGSWREEKPWVFGEFCDYDVFRNIEKVRQRYNGELPWWLKNDLIENPGSKEDRWHWYRQEEKMTQLNLPFSSQQIAENANKSAFVYRKAVLELVRSYQKITGYALTSIKGNPIATSSIFDDFGNPNHPPKAFKQFNNSTVISLTWDNRRNWINGGDRLINWDSYNYFSNDTFRPHLFISHYDSNTIKNASINWQLHTEDETLLAVGEISDINLSRGEAKEVGIAEVVLPVVSEPVKLVFFAKLMYGTEMITNEWTFWLFPEEQLKPFGSSITIQDPLHLLTGIEKIYPEFSYLKIFEPSDTRVIVTSLLQPHHYEFMDQGGRVLYIQRGEGEFEIDRLPFWRESIQLFHTHPIIDSFPHENHTGMALYGVGTDTAFNRSTLPACSPLMDRLDARTFELTNYLFETQVGKGKLIATTLRFEGGLGSQPTGITQNTAGLYFFETIVKYLMEN